MVGDLYRWGTARQGSPLAGGGWKGMLRSGKLLV